MFFFSRERQTGIAIPTVLACPGANYDAKRSADTPHRDKHSTSGGNGDRERDREIERECGSDDVTTAAIYMYTSFFFFRC